MVLVRPDCEHLSPRPEHEPDLIWDMALASTMYARRHVVYECTKEKDKKSEDDVDAPGKHWTTRHVESAITEKSAGGEPSLLL